MNPVTESEDKEEIAEDGSAKPSLLQRLMFWKKRQTWDDDIADSELDETSDSHEEEVSDDEVTATGDRQIQQLVQQIGSMEKVLEYYRKESIEDFREELFDINKLRMLSNKMRQKIIGDIEVTPEEVRQFFNKIPENESLIQVRKRPGTLQEPPRSE